MLENLQDKISGQSWRRKSEISRQSWCRRFDLLKVIVRVIVETECDEGPIFCSFSVWISKRLIDSLTAYRCDSYTSYFLHLEITYQLVSNIVSGHVKNLCSFTPCAAQPVPCNPHSRCGLRPKHTFAQGRMSQKKKGKGKDYTLADNE